MTWVIGLTFRPVISPWFIGALICVGLGTLGWSLWRDRGRPLSERLGLAGCRVIALSALVVVLAGPSAIEPAGSSSKPVTLRVFIDTSKSMAEALSAQDRRDQDQSGETSRWSAVKRYWLSSAARQELSDAATVQWQAFTGSVRPVSSGRVSQLNPTGDATHLFEALGQSANAARSNVSSDSTAGEETRFDPVLVLSDGHDTQRSSAPGVVSRLAKREQRVFVVPIGKADGSRALSVQAWPTSDRVFEGDTARITASVRHRGLSGRRVKVRLTRGGRTIEEKEVTLTGAISKQVSFTVKPATEPGETTTTRMYRVTATLDEAEAKSREASRLEKSEVNSQGSQTPQASNALSAGGAQNQATRSDSSVFLDVSKSQIRVLLLEGAPYWDSRAFARIVQAHPRLSLTAIYQLGGQRRLVMNQARSAKGEWSGDVELTLRRLKQFDVIALGKRIDRFFEADTATRLTKYVRQGGALVLVRGQPFDASAIETTTAASVRDALEPIMPVEWGRSVVEDLRLSLTPAGRSSPLLSMAEEDRDAGTVFTRRPGMLAATRVARSKAASIVMMQQRARRGVQEEHQTGDALGQADTGSGKETADGGQAKQPGQPMAAMAQMRVGSGRVLAILSDGLWRWAMHANKPEGTTGENERVDARRSRSNAVNDSSSNAPERSAGDANGELSLIRDNNDAPLADFWSRAIHWLAAGGEFLPGQNLDLTIKPRQPRAGEAVRVQLKSRYPLGSDVEPIVRITRDGKQTNRLRLAPLPGRANAYEATFTPTDPGVVQVALVPSSVPDSVAGPVNDAGQPDESATSDENIAGASSNTTSGADKENAVPGGDEARDALQTRLVVRPGSLEQADTTPRPDVLKRLAEATGGRALPIDGRAALIEYLEQLKAARQPARALRYHFDRWWLLAAIVIPLLVEWAWRQRTATG